MLPQAPLGLVLFYKVIPSHLIIVGDDGNRTRVSVACSPVAMPSLATFHPQVVLVPVVPFCGSAVSSTARYTFCNNSISARICPHRLVCGGFLFALAHLLTFMLCFVCKTCMVVRFFVCKSVRYVRCVPNDVLN